MHMYVESLTADEEKLLLLCRRCACRDNFEACASGHITAGVCRSFEPKADEEKEEQS